MRSNGVPATIPSNENTIDGANDCFVRNMRLLWRHDPELALQLDAIHDDERYPVIPTRSGHCTMQLVLDDAAGDSAAGVALREQRQLPAAPAVAVSRPATTLLHSRVDPVAEAATWAEAVELEDKYCFVVSGFGLGYHLAALFSRLRGDAFILCLEPNLRVIATALAHVDLAAALDSGRLLILADADKGRMHRRLAPLGTLMMLGAQFLRHAPSVRVEPQGHAALHAAMQEFVTFTRTSLMTTVSNARITCKNVAMNLVHYVSTPPIDLLRDCFAGDPAIIISAGPSLSRIVDQLEGLKGRAVLCAVQTALRPLMNRGIVPDFVTSLDFHEISRKFFEGVGDLRHTHLVAEPKATWHVIDEYPGPISLLDNAWARLVIGDALGARGGLPAGATVAHLAFCLSVYLGCDPIIFVGQDLAYTGHVFYTPGVEIHRAWTSEINRFCSIEHKEWERIARNRPILRRVAGNESRTLYTDELLLTYLEQFEKDIAATSRRVINATQGGARIRGAEPMPLAQVVEQFCERPIDSRKFAYRESVQWRDASRLGPAGEQIDARVRELDEMTELCDELLVLLPELRELADDPARFNRKLLRIDELRTKVQHNARPYRIVNAATQLIELRRFSADRRIGAADAPDAERARHQIARDIEFITGVRDGVQQVKPILLDAVARLEDPPWRTGE